MAYSYTTRNGQRVEVNVAAAFDRMASAFRSATGCNLLVRSGTRTYTEQKNIFLSRYVTAGNINGRKVYDTRVWNGTRYYRVSSAGTVAVPGTSNHEETGPNGPRSLDVYDSGSDAGVTRFGTARDRWMQNNAGKYGFQNEGNNFNEPWHKTYRGTIGGGAPAGGGSTSTGALAEDGKLGPATVKALQKVLGVTQDGDWGAATTTALQKKLIAYGHKISADGQLGPATIRAMQIFLLGASKADGVMGPETIRGLQHYLNVGGTFTPKPTTPPTTSGKLTVDGQLGPATIKALQTVLGVTADGQLGPNTIKALQSKLVALGHKISVDGEMGPATIKALQTFILGASKADGQLGPETIKGLQNYLNSGGKFVASTPTPPTTPPATDKLVVDGQMGPATVKALQKKLGVTVDGEMGPNTIKALQKVLGQAQDGQMGNKTIKALQMNVGATVDGAMGPNTIKALQTFLNEGKNFTAVIVTDTPIVTYPKPAAPTYPGATWWNHSPNSSPRRDGDRVQYFVVHHAADTNTVETQRTRFMNPNDRNVSPNWLIGKDGSVSEIVPPDKYRAWTTGQFDYNAVTVETQNSSGSPTWGITEESHVAIAKLVAWASKRYGFPIDRQHVLGHREVPNVPATACPGPSMDLDKIVTLAKKFAAETTPTEPTPTLWKIEIPRDEAVAAGKALDEAIAVMTQFRKLLP